MVNLFRKAKDKKSEHKCQYCDIDFKPDARNLNRGWGLFCSKSCSSKWRTKIKNMKDSTSEIRDYKMRQLGIE